MNDTEANEDFIARPYQQAIIDVCIKRNSIVFLPTGAGKSYIAIQVIRHFSKAIEGKYSEGAKRSIFLVNTVCLAKQQEESINDLVPYNVQMLTGEQNVDLWNESDWKKVFENNQILVSTAQVILDAIKRSYLKTDRINVLVFDECHHGRKDHAYHELMKQFENPVPENVRIIGLSGMLIGNHGKIKSHTVVDELQQLEGTFQSTIITVNNIDDHQNVLLFSTNASENFVRFTQEPTRHDIEVISNILQTHANKLKPIKFDKYETKNPKTLLLSLPGKIKDLLAMFNDFDYQARDMGPYGGYISLLGTLVQLELTLRWSDTEIYRHIVKTCITVVELCISKMETMFGLRRTSTDPSTILMNSSEKVRTLFRILQIKFTDPNREKDLQCLVFVKRRATAKSLYHALKAYASSDEGFPIKPDFMVGVNNELPESIECILSNNNNSITLEKFKKKETNLIVSSSVLEEGIDLQMCNLVVVYDKPDTYRSYVQAKGRARVNNSNYVVLVESDKIEDFIKKVQNWRSVDAELKKQLLMKTLDREPPTRDTIQREREEVWEPFYTENSKSVLNNLNAVSLLHHYASKLPSDRFTNTNVYWRRIELDDGKVQAALELPSNSNIKDEIFGDPQNNVRLAKQHAAFKACILLYENGELNDNLVPIDDKQKIEIHNDEYFSHWDAYSNDKKTAGNRNHRRYHQMSTPAVLENCAPKVGAQSFLYHIKFVPKFEATNKAFKEFHKLLSNEKDFGILMSKRMPRLCQFKLFQSFGEIQVEISSIPFPVTLKDGDELNTLQNFHVAIFKDVLNTWEKFFVLDTTSYLIVPLTDNVEIDWGMVYEFQSIEKPRRLTYDEINNTEFSRRAYHHRVVNPVYKNTSQKYIVIDVPEYLTAESPFPNDKYSSYKEYFEVNFDLSIVKGNQPMIEAKGVSGNHNMFFPGAGAMGKQRKHEKEQMPEHFIPELCHNYRFPGSCWLRATLLPSICHRIKEMLKAEELRVWLVDQKIDQSYGKQLFSLDIDYGNYDDRENMLAEIERQRETYGPFSSLHLSEHLKQNEQKRGLISTGTANHSSTFLPWDRTDLPIDIDRNWLNVTEVDLIYYCNFLRGNKNQITPACRSRQQVSPAPIHNRFLMDTDDRNDIKILRKVSNGGSCVQQKDLLKVLTTSNAADVFDMERYEVLGDGFLKFITSLYLYKKYEDWNEGHLTSLKGKIVSNRNLFYVGINSGLARIIKSSRFDSMESLPPSIRVPANVQDIVEKDKRMLIKMCSIEMLSQDEIITGQINSLAFERFREQQMVPQDPEDEARTDRSYLAYINQHYVGDKIIADGVEAFLGVVVQSLGIEAGLKLCQKLNILPETKNITNFLTEKIPPRALVKNASPNDVRVQNREELEKIIGYQFKEPKYLLQALTHASHPIKVMGTYQQLEFLGDAVLDFLVTSYISEQCPKLDPGKLTDLRSSLVNNVTLACVVVRNGIHKFLLSGNVLLSESIKKFVAYQHSKGNRVVLDQIILLETEEDASAAEAVDVPKVVGDLFESIVGAVFLDCGLNLEQTWDVIYNLLKQELHEFMVNIPMQIIRQLYEYEKGSAEPKFYDPKVVEDDLIAVPLEFYCGLDNDGVKKIRKIVVGIAKNKSLAKKCAAKLAMRALKAIKEN